jgi:hypothetical protein
LPAERPIVPSWADPWAAEAVPGENADTAAECRVQMQFRRGIRNIANPDLSRPVADRVRTFLAVRAPLRGKAATGSQGNPIALCRAPHAAPRITPTRPDRRP